MEKRLSIIIPFYDRWELTHSCLGKLYGAGIRPYEVILVDDASTEADIHKGINWWKSTNLLQIKYTKNAENMGFGYSMNKGAEYASGDILLLLSNDVSILNKKPIDDLITELTNNDKQLIGQELIAFDSGWNRIHSVIVPYLAGHFLACTKEAWLEIGGFDPIYSPVDYEDIDISVRFLLGGFKLKALNSMFIAHLFGGTIKTKYGDVGRLEITERNRDKFSSKWSFEELQKAVDLYGNNNL